MVGREGGQVFDGVLCGLVTDKDGDLGYPHGLGDTLGIHELFIRVVGYLVINRCQPRTKKVRKSG